MADVFKKIELVKPGGQPDRHAQLMVQHNGHSVLSFTSPGSNFTFHMTLADLEAVHAMIGAAIEQVGVGK